MGYIKAIRDEEEEIFNTPDSSGRSNLRQSPANPYFDGIAEQQGHTDYGGQDLGKLAYPYTLQSRIW